MDSVRPTAEVKGVRLRMTASSVEGIVMGDRNRLQQVVWNLLSNAIKFTPKGGTVQVVIERVNSHMEIRVTDNGIGIPPEYLGHIFERFSQADASTTRRHGGLGLGLSIAKHLVELHGGVISATSAGPGQGATFRVELPLLPVSHDPARDASERRMAELDRTLPKQDLEGVQILLVEDDPDSAEVVNRILTRRGAIVRWARTMEEALAAVEAVAPNVLLSDIGLPDHDGYELIAKVRELPHGHRLPAVALTALARGEDRARALRAGFQMHVAKPVESAELVAVVRNLANLRER
jgi:CheY-like chemotaxis protein/anti-sigma regulatory factor (Ser/Thr protein kinase)